MAMMLKRLGKPAAGLVLAAALLTGLGACAPEPTKPDPDGSASASASASAAAAAASSADASAAASADSDADGVDSAADAGSGTDSGAQGDPTGVIEADWQRISEPKGPVSFELPPGWRFERSETAYDEPYGIFGGVVRNEAGTAMLTYANWAMGLGGACTPQLPKVNVTELDSTPVSPAGYQAATSGGGAESLVAPHFAYRLAEFDGGVLASMALTDRQPVQGTCMFYNLVSTTGRTGFFTTHMQVDTNTKPGLHDSRQAAEAYMQTDEYKQLKRVLLSVNFAE